MTRRPITLLSASAALPLIAVAVAACGGSSAATGSPPPAPAQAQAPAKAKTTKATIRTANTRLGRILVDSQGRTVYLFKADSGNMSACTGACAVAWPPLLVAGKPAAGTGVTGSKLGTITRAGGGTQVTYNGHPLYLFIKDTQPGQTNGQGVTAFGAAWFALSPAGEQISAKSSRPAGASPAAPAAKPQPAPKPASQPSPAKPASPVAKPKPPANNGIPQNNGGDGDADNNGGPSDGDGNI